MRHRLNRSSVKESFDTLPSGICFFSEKGVMVLCNRTMHRLVYLMTGRDMQSLGDLRGALESPSPDTVCVADEAGHSFRFPDGTVWSFFETPVTDQYGNRYIQFAAQEVTELHRLADELDQRNEDVKELIAQFQRIAANVVDIVRQEEILAAKMRIHRKMGGCIVNTQRYCIQNCPAEGKDELLRVWEDTLSALEDEIGQEDDVDAVKELIRVAENCGVQIVITGNLPENKEIPHILVVAMRESLTNLIVHAEGNRLDAVLNYENNTITAVMTNNGKAPACEISEGGGLTSLRKRIENAGGSMRVQSLPFFALTVTLPDKETNT